MADVVNPMLPPPASYDQFPRWWNSVVAPRLTRAGQIELTQIDGTTAEPGDIGAASQEDMDAAEADILALDASVSGLTTDVGTLTTDVGTLQTDLGTLDTTVDGHIAATSAHSASGDIIGRDDLATTIQRGPVFAAAAVSDALPSGVSVSSPDAAAQTAAYVQADVQSIATLANEMKGDVNQLKNDLNDLTTTVNDLLAAKRAAEQLAT